MRETWTLTYAGAPDDISKAGVAAPSWHTFDKRVWRLGDLELTLINLHNHYGYKRHYPFTQFLRYKVTVCRGSEILHLETGNDWMALVKRAKDHVPQVSCSASGA